MKIADINSKKVNTTLSTGVTKQTHLSYNCPRCNNPAYTFTIPVAGDLGGRFFENGIDADGNMTILTPIYHSHLDPTQRSGKCEITFIIKQGVIVRV